MLASSASAAVGALAAGTDGYVLTADSTQTLGIKWAAAGSAGALVQIAATTLGSAAANITFSSISGSYSALWVHLTAASDQATTAQSVSMQFNTDTGSNYDYAGVYGNNNTGSPGQESGVGVTSAAICAIPGSTAPANACAAVEILIPSYAGTTFKKGYLAHNARESGTTLGTILTEAVGGFWRSTAAITSIKLFPGTGNFVTGTSAVLYGVS